MMDRAATLDKPAEGSEEDEIGGRIEAGLKSLEDKTDRVWFKGEVNKLKLRHGEKKKSLAWIMIGDIIGKALLQYQSAKSAEKGGYTDKGLHFDKTEWGNYFAAINKMESSDIEHAAKQVSMYEKGQARVDSLKARKEGLSRNRLNTKDRLNSIIMRWQEEDRRADPMSSRDKDYFNTIKAIDGEYSKFKTAYKAKSADKSAVIETYRTSIKSQLERMQPPIGQDAIDNIMKTEWFKFDITDTQESYRDLIKAVSKQYYSGQQALTEDQVPNNIKKQWVDGGRQPLIIGDTPGKMWKYTGDGRGATPYIKGAISE